MVFGNSLNPKTSLLISLLSGVGLLAVVSIAPTKDEIQEELPPNHNVQNESSGDLQGFKDAVERNRNSMDGNPPKSKLLNLKITPQDIKEYSKQQKFLRDRLGPTMGNYGKILNVSNFTSDRYQFNQNLKIDQRSTEWDDRIRMESSHNFNTFINQGILDGLYGKTTGRTSGRYNNVGYKYLDHVDINVPISRSISAVFTTSSRDIYDDRRREGQFNNYAFAGISLNKGKRFTTRFVAGDTNLQIHRQGYRPELMAGNRLQERRDPGFNERESNTFRAFEWQTNIKPTKGIRLQTAIYNNPNNNIDSKRQNSSLPDSGRMSVFLGEKKVILNMKYDYQMSDPNVRSVLRDWQPQRDSASLGFIFFLDNSRSYSIYLGGNQFNITDSVQGVSRQSPDSEKLPASFTASFRGKAKGQSNSSFFVNFQNQPPGMWGMGMPNQMNGADQLNQNSKSFYEYATTLGLEVNF